MRQPGKTGATCTVAQRKDAYCRRAAAWIMTAKSQTSKKTLSVRFDSSPVHQGSDALRFNVTPQKSKKRDNRQKTAQAIPIGSRERPLAVGKDPHNLRGCTVARPIMK